MLVRPRRASRKAQHDWPAERRIMALALVKPSASEARAKAGQWIRREKFKKAGILCARPMDGNPGAVLAASPSICAFSCRWTGMLCIQSRWTLFSLEIGFFHRCAASIGRIIDIERRFWVYLQIGRRSRQHSDTPIWKFASRWMIFEISSVILYTFKLDANSDGFASSALIVLRPIPRILNIDADFVYTCELDADPNGSWFCSIGKGRSASNPPRICNFRSLIHNMVLRHCKVPMKNANISAFFIGTLRTSGITRKECSKIHKCTNP